MMEDIQVNSIPLESAATDFSASLRSYLRNVGTLEMLSSDEQQAYADSFSTISDYITWFNSEKAKYDNSQAIEITGPIDLGDLVGKNNG